MKKTPYPTFDKKRPLSWSAISSFEWDPEQWYRKYVLHLPDPPTKEMLFGLFIGKQLETNKHFMPWVPRQNKMEHKFNGKLGKIPLVGVADSFCITSLRYGEEYKTGKKAWNQIRADEHGQITLYSLLNFQVNNIRPEDVIWRVHWLPTIEDSDFTIKLLDPKKIHTFETRRTMQEVIEFGTRIKRVYKEMEEYCKNHV